MKASLRAPITFSTLVEPPVATAPLRSAVVSSAVLAVVEPAVEPAVLVVAVLSEPPQATRPAAITHAIAIAIKRFIFILSYSLFFSIHSNEFLPLSPLLCFVGVEFRSRLCFAFPRNWYHYTARFAKSARMVPLGFC